MSDDIRMALSLAEVLAARLSRSHSSDGQPNRVILMVIIGTFATGQAKSDLILLTSDPIGTFATTHPKKRNP